MVTIAANDTYDTLESRVRAILKAQSTLDPLDDLVAHAKAVAAGKAILPVISEQLSKTDWSDRAARGRLGALTALMLVARDIDEDATRDIAAALVREKPLLPTVAERLKSISSFSLADYHQFEIRGLDVFVSRTLGKPNLPVKSLARWLTVIPERDLRGISRLFVIPPEALERFWGEYLRVLSVVSLVWRGRSVPGLGARLATEITLYHEIGHHHHRRFKGSHSENEILADKYSMNLFASAHPILGRGILGRMLFALVVGR